MEEKKKRLRPVRFLVERYNRSAQDAGSRVSELGLLPPPIYINGYRYWDEGELDRFDATRKGQSRKQKRDRPMPLGARRAAEEAASILYHLTRKKHLDSILEHGLLPTIGENLVMTMGIPAVHLSASKDPRWTLHFHADAILLEVEPRKKRLFHWRTWALENGIDVAELQQTIEDEFGKEVADDNRFHYVHFGIIPVSRLVSWQELEFHCENEAALRAHQEELQRQPWGAA